MSKQPILPAVNTAPPETSDLLWEDVVAYYDPNWQWGQTRREFWQFEYVVFKNKFNQYDDSEPYLGSEGYIQSPGRWLFT